MNDLVDQTICINSLLEQTIVELIGKNMSYYSACNYLKNNNFNLDCSCSCSYYNNEFVFTYYYDESIVIVKEDVIFNKLKDIYEQLS